MIKLEDALKNVFDNLKDKVFVVVDTIYRYWVHFSDQLDWISKFYGE